MDLKIISELIRMVSESKLTSLEVQEKDLRIKLEKGNKVLVSDEIGIDRSASLDKPSIANLEPKFDLINVSNPSDINQNNKTLVQEVIDETDCKIVKAPIVGTFYSASSPDSEPFVSKGKKIKKGETICIIEAMKLMNEIESEFDGEVIDILVENGSIVEYGQPLLKIR